jgi:hypothetical protein
VPLKTPDGHASKAGEIFHHHKRDDAGSRLSIIYQFELFLPFENFPGK